MRATIVLVAAAEDVAEFEAALATELAAAAARIADELELDVDDVGFESITVEGGDVDELELEGDGELDDDGDDADDDGG